MPVQAAIQGNTDVVVAAKPAIVSNFKLVIGDRPITIGDSNPVWLGTFSTPPQTQSQPAILMFNVKGLTSTKTPVDIKINHVSVGQIMPYGHEKVSVWHTQMVAFNGETLTGINEIEIAAVKFPGATPTNTLDDFQIKDMICFFHQLVN